MKEICSIAKCTGCALCAAECPKHSIRMIEGYLGHLFPIIDQETCIDCGLCQKRCPSLNRPSMLTPSVVYAGWAKDEADYKTSTSGAAASVLSQYTIDNGGVVYGCSMLANVDVRHIRLENKKDLYKLKGSKYVQSSIEEVIPQLKVDVKNGRQVLFIGTPCQVAAISNLYNKRPENLFLVDIICHGVPSLKSLQDHVKQVAPYDHYDTVIFRENSYVVVVVVVDGKEVYRKELFKERFADVYLNAFFDGFTYRDSCYNCQYACKERVSDITIGDFWGLGANMSTNEIPNHPNGCSAILINTSVGKHLFGEVMHQLYAFERPLDECVDGNEQLRHPKRLSPRIKAYRWINKVVNAPNAYYLVNADLIIKAKRKSK